MSIIHHSKLRRLSLAAILSAAGVGCANHPLSQIAQAINPEVRNGSFESPKVNGSYLRIAPGMTLDGWTISGGAVDLIGDYWAAADGKQSLHLARDAAIAQTIQTTKGQMYQLRYALGLNPDGDNKPRAVQVWWGDTLVDTQTRTNNEDRSGQWMQFVFPVVATSDHTTLKFVTLEGGEFGVAVDRVSVTPGTDVAASQ